MQKKHLQASDLRAIAQLLTQGTLGVTRITEGVHQSVWRTLGLPGGAQVDQTRGLTGLIYKSINGITQTIGRSVDAALHKLQPLLELLESAPADSPQRAAVLAALNGVMGDRLAAEHSLLAMSMSLRMQGRVLNWQAMPAISSVTSKVLIVIHGLSMNDLQWTAQHQGHEVNHATALADALGYTPVYVRYNTGLHTSQNGHALAEQLTQLILHWPMPVAEISVLAHSMGGLVTRSAVQVAKQGAMAWPKLLKNLAFLGTPHHGAPLERAGNWVDVILGSTPFSRPFAKLGQLRSAGITDLRYGHVLDQDWQGHARFRRKPDSRTALPLPEGVACFAVAATTAGKRSLLADRLVGDGLVPLHSALGQHDEPARCLIFAPQSQCILYRMNHMQLLSSPLVTQQLLAWLKPANLSSNSP
jgi:pimeloyl-ACP methyl ester carboxylesterase